ncbi:MAG: helix-turn-helix transcriptional regulator [Phycisphaerae bacterium]|nr:helix-turn-helix transcriptional regulator [Phycisphaerae bacterium]
MGRAQSLRAADVSNLLNLLNAAHEIPDLLGKQQYVSQEISRLMRAKVVFYAHARDINPVTGGIFALLGQGGSFYDAERRLYSIYWNHEYGRDPAWINMLPHCGRPFTVRREQAISDKDWYRSAHFNEYRKINKLDQFIYSCFPLTDRNEIAAFGVNREFGDKPFDERERLMMELITPALEWLYRMAPAGAAAAPGALAPAADPLAALSPSLRRVARALVEGDSAKQAAARLGLRVNTVQSYMKQIYRLLGVNTRTELVLKALRGGEPLGWAKSG